MMTWRGVQGQVDGVGVREVQGQVDGEGEGGAGTGRWCG